MRVVLLWIVACVGNSAWAVSLESVTAVSDGHFIQSLSGRGRFQKPRPELKNPFLARREREELLQLPGEPGVWGWHLGYSLATASSWALGHDLQLGLDWDPREDVRFSVGLGLETLPSEGYGRQSLDLALSYVFPTSVIVDPDHVVVIDDEPKPDLFPGFDTDGSPESEDSDAIRLRRAQAIEALQQEDHFLLRGQASLAGQERGSVISQNSFGVDLIYTTHGVWSFKTGYTAHVYSEDPGGLLGGFSIFQAGTSSVTTSLSSLRKLFEAFPKDQFRLGTAGFIGESWLVDLELSYSRYHLAVLPMGYGVLPGVQHFFSDRFRMGLGVDLLFAESGYSVTGLLSFSLSW